MRRIDDWVTALNAALARHQAAPGAWGKSDCWMATMDAVEAMTGTALLPALRGYSSERAGYRLFAASGFKTVRDALASVLFEGPPLQAFRGDIAVVPGGNGPSCGIVTTSGVAVKTLHEDGTSAMRFVPITDALTAFRV